jgi:hypothetical protein
MPKSIHVDESRRTCQEELTTGGIDDHRQEESFTLFDIVGQGEQLQKFKNKKNTPQLVEE